MYKWTVVDRFMYQEYLEWRDELYQLQQSRWITDEVKERRIELENNIRKFLKSQGEESLRNIILWSHDIDDDL